MVLCCRSRIDDGTQERSSTRQIVARTNHCADRGNELADPIVLRVLGCEDDAKFSLNSWRKRASTSGLATNPVESRCWHFEASNSEWHDDRKWSPSKVAVQQVWGYDQWSAGVMF